MKQGLSPRLVELCQEFSKNPIAAGLTWKDITTHDKYAVEKTPTTFEYCGVEIRIIISCGHIHYPGIFIFSCRRLGIENRITDAQTPKEAAEKAIAACVAQVKKICLELGIKTDIA